MNWDRLSDNDAEVFIDAVADKDYKILFEPSICDVFIYPLSFYDGYHLTRIANKYTVPYMQFDYLSNGEDHYYLDGSENVFHNLNTRGAISLDINNVFQYLSLYISYVYEYGNSLEFVGDETNSKVSYDAAEDVYVIETPLRYQDDIVAGKIEVTPEGALHVKSPLEVSFLDNLKPKDALSYVHPYTENIIEECKSLLSITQTGQSLLKTAQHLKPAIRVLNSPNYQSFCSNLRVIHLSMPAEERTAKYLQMLMMAGAIRDMEQIFDGAMHPHPIDNEDIYGEITLGKNLDQVLEMCKIVDELEELNIPEGLHELGKMGLAGFYQVYKTGADEDTLTRVYIDALGLQDIVREI